jgi:hypothetical protein
MQQQRFRQSTSLPFRLQPGRATLNESRAATRYIFNWPSAARAALLAAAAITLYMLFVPRLLGIEQMDIGITVGRLTDPSGGGGAFLGRVAWHVGNGLVYVIPYAAVLVCVQRQSTARTGAVFGVVLWLVGPMLLIPILLTFHPRVWSGELTNPGIFMLALGLGWKPAAVDLGAHLIHGILAGGSYKHRWARVGQEGDGA